MALSGSTQTMSLADLLQWAAGAKKNGRFDFRSGAIVKEVYLQDGLIVASASNQPTEMLGHTLVARGKLNEEQLRAALLARQESDAFLGQVLVKLGFVSREDLLRALAERTEEIVYSLFESEPQQFHFEPDAQPAPQMVLISMSIDHLLLRGVQRHDEMALIREVFPDGRVVLTHGKTEPPKAILEHALARQIFDLLDGERTIDELAMQIHTRPFPVMKFLSEAYHLGLVEIVSLEGPSTMVITNQPIDNELTELTGSARLDAARERLDRGDAESTLALLGDIDLAQDSEARELFERAEARFLKDVFRDELPRDAIPELTRPIEDMTSEQLRPEEFFLLSRIDGQWTINDVIEIAPARVIDTVQALRRLTRRGLVRVPVHVEA